MCDEPLADDRPFARQNLEESGRKARLDGQFAKTDRGERCPFRWLQQHSVSGGKRGRETPGCNGHGKVPWHDDADNPERLEEGHVDTAGHRDGLADHPLRGRGIVVEHITNMPCLPARLRDRMPGVCHFEARKIFQITVDGRREAPERSGTVRRRQRRPGALGRHSIRDRVIHLLEGGVHDGLQRALRRRVDQKDAAHCPASVMLTLELWCFSAA